MVVTRKFPIYIAALSHLETITLPLVGASVMNRRQPKLMGLILMTRQDLLNASLQPLLLDVGWIGVM